MAKEIRESTIKALLEAHLDELKKISEGIQSILVVQLAMKKELESMRPIKEEWPLVKTTIRGMNKDIRIIKQDVKYAKYQVNDLDKKVSLVLPNHERRITRLEQKPA